jgi:hypothetical protein
MTLRIAASISKNQNQTSQSSFTGTGSQLPAPSRLRGMTKNIAGCGANGATGRVLTAQALDVEPGEP